MNGLDHLRPNLSRREVRALAEDKKLERRVYLRKLRETKEKTVKQVERLNARPSAVNTSAYQPPSAPLLPRIVPRTFLDKDQLAAAEALALSRGKK